MAVGPVLIALVLLVVGPIAVMLGGAIWTAFLGFFLVEDADERAA